MKKITVSIGLALALALPAGALAKPHPDQGDKRAAKAECKTLRGNSSATREAFSTQFRSFAACVRKTAVEEAQEEQNAHKNAAKECKAERGTTRKAALRSRTSTARAPRSATPSASASPQKAKAKEAAADEQDQQDATAFKNAAKACDAERGDTTESRAAFAEKYGTGPNKRNAFGKCVSKKARGEYQLPTQ